MPANRPHNYSDLLQRHERVEAELSAARREIERKDQIIAGLQQRFFGKKSERHDPNQCQLEFGEEVLGKLESHSPNHCDEECEPEKTGENQKPAKKRRRKKDLLPRNLPVVIEAVIVPDEVKANPDAYLEIGEEHHDELEVTRSEMFYRRTICKKYKSKADRKQPPISALMPEASIPGTMVAPDLMAMLLTDKYTDHLPHYRQAERFLRRQGAELSRQTINRWTHLAGDLLSPIGEAIKIELREATVLQIDETPADYLNPGHGKVGQGYLWYYRDVKTGTIYCDWQLGRGHDCMLDILGLDGESKMARFRGMIQCDGYSAYQALIKRYGEILLAGCLAHIRRKFYEAREQSPEVVMPILALIASLYRIERNLAEIEAPPDSRELVRGVHARPLVAELKDKILTEREKHLPQSKLGEALNYALNQWEEFERYLSDGSLEIDNNKIENAIRPAKLGLKNYLFFGGAEAGATSALFYTLVGNCKALGIDPELYLAEVLRRMTSTTTVEQAAGLTPSKLADEIRSRQVTPRGEIDEDDASPQKAAA